MNDEPKINFDTPLQATDALQRDKLSRTSFAKAAAMSLQKASSTKGLVVSIEGAWGSGKTSVLALIEALINGPDPDSQPVIVHFNPWIIGEKDAFLRHFLSRIANAIKLSDNSRDGKRVATEIKAYSKAFDLVKLIPGAEPWASLIKSVVGAAGEAAGAIAEYKSPDIEAYKQKLEEALRNFPRPIIVFIDDIDRLFPLEVFEMVRIIKAVGDLPNVGYVVAWDSAYVSRALENLGVPFAHSYLDKVVQVRMQLPRLSLAARRNFVNDELNQLHPEALRPRFKDQDDRLAHLYRYGLRDLLEQPRDIARVFNAVRLMEPLLRDEVVFADILGLTALSVKAPEVYELLRRDPRLFVDASADEFSSLDKSRKDAIENGISTRQAAYEASGLPSSVKQVVHFLFPLVAKAEGSYGPGKPSFVDGNIAHPGKLSVALQLSITDDDVSIKAARRYLQEPDQRPAVLASLTSENCTEFLELLGDFGKSIGGDNIFDLDVLCLDVARLSEHSLFVNRARARNESFSLHAEDAVLDAIGTLIEASDQTKMSAISKKIAMDSIAISCAAEIVSRSYHRERLNAPSKILVTANSREEILKAFGANVLQAARDGVLFDKINPGFVLWTTARLIPDICPKIYRVLMASAASLDKFALSMLGGSWDSTNGAYYSVPNDQSLLYAYCSIEQFKSYARKRLKDKSLLNPSRAAWRSVVEEKSFYGVDGTEAGRWR